MDSRAATLTRVGGKALAVALPKGRSLALVYQAGLANVFSVTDLSGAALDRTGQRADRRRIFQGDFRTAETLVYGAALGGRTVRTFARNVAGDVGLHDWDTDVTDMPFADQAQPQDWN